MRTRSKRACRAAAERLGDRALALDELGVGLEQLDLGVRSEVGAQGDERFETGDPAAGDDDPGHVVEARRHAPRAPSVASPHRPSGAQTDHAGGTALTSSALETACTARGTSMLTAMASRSGRTSGARGAPARVAR